jgi:hypothetical protein
VGFWSKIGTFKIFLKRLKMSCFVLQIELSYLHGRSNTAVQKEIKMANTIKIGEIEIKAICAFDMIVHTTLEMSKNGVVIATIKSYDIDSKIKPENRNAVKELVKFCESSYVLTDGDVDQMNQIAKTEKVHNDYVAHTAKMNKAMSI